MGVNICTLAPLCIARTSSRLPLGREFYILLTYTKGSTFGFARFGSKTSAKTERLYTNLFDLHHKYADVMGVDAVVTHFDVLKAR